MDAGADGLTDDVQESMRNVTGELEELRLVDSDNGRALKFTDEELQARNRANAAVSQISARWQAISANVKSLKTDQLDALENDLRASIVHAGDTSNLILDPDLDSYYL